MKRLLEYVTPFTIAGVIVAIILLYNFIPIVLERWLPFLFGASISERAIRNFDTEAVSENYKKFKNEISDDVIEVRFNSSNNEFIEKNCDDVHITVYIYPDKKYSKNLNALCDVDIYHFKTYSNSVWITKNNIRIYAYEYTDKIRSKNIQKAVEHVLSEFGAL